MFQILFKDAEGYDVLMSDQMTEEMADITVQRLSNSGISAVKVKAAEKKWPLAKVVFDLQLIPSAKKAIKNGTEMKGVYTFGDPDKIAKEDSAVVVECTTAEKKVAYVVGLWQATAEEIKAFKTRIGYSKLGLVVKKV